MNKCHDGQIKVSWVLQYSECEVTRNFCCEFEFSYIVLQQGGIWRAPIQRKITEK